MKRSGGGSATKERSQPRGGTGINKPVPPGRDMRKSAGQGGVTKKTNQRKSMR